MKLYTQFFHRYLMYNFFFFNLKPRRKSCFMAHNWSNLTLVGVYSLSAVVRYVHLHHDGIEKEEKSFADTKHTFVMRSCCIQLYSMTAQQLYFRNWIEFLKRISFYNVNTPHKHILCEHSCLAPLFMAHSHTIENWSKQQIRNTHTSYGLVVLQWRNVPEI